MSEFCQAFALVTNCSSAPSRFPARMDTPIRLAGFSINKLKGVPLSTIMHAFMGGYHIYSQTSKTKLDFHDHEPTKENKPKLFLHEKGDYKFDAHFKKRIQSNLLHILNPYKLPAVNFSKSSYVLNSSYPQTSSNNALSKPTVPPLAGKLP